MKRIAVTGAIAIALATGRAWAAETTAPQSKRWQDQVTLTLSDRVRGEFVDWFEPPTAKAQADAHRYDFFANQLRFGAKIDAPHLQLVAEGQDTRLVNLPRNASPPATEKSVGNLGPGALYYFNTHDRDQGELFVKQGYLVVKDIPGAAGVTLTGGRFEYSDGLETIPSDPALAWLKRARIGERLIGPFGYTHVSRSFDGVRGVYDNADVNVTGFGTKPTQGGFEISANRELTDVWLGGLAVTLKQLDGLPPFDARVFYIYYRDGREDAAKVDNRSLSTIPGISPGKDHHGIDIHTWGAHAVSVLDVGPGRIDGLLWTALQHGDWGQLNHFGWAFAVETGYQLPRVFAAPWLRVGFDEASGDDNPNDNRHETFFQILPTARIYAQTPFYNLMNSEDFFVQLILKPHSKVTVRGDYHWVRLTEIADLWYGGGGATNDGVFGFTGLNTHGHGELAHFADLAITINLLKQLTAYAYAGHVFGQSAVKGVFGPDGDNANYGYVELALRY